MGAGDLISLSYKCNRSQDYPQPFRSSAMLLGFLLPARANSALASEISTNIQKLPLFSHLGSLVSLNYYSDAREWMGKIPYQDTNNFKKRIITSNG